MRTNFQISRLVIHFLTSIAKNRLQQAEEKLGIGNAAVLLRGDVRE